MNNSKTLLPILQHGDSFFPSGAISFSWGLEALASDRKVCSATELENFVSHQLLDRWASSDRAVICAVNCASDNIDNAIEYDYLLEASCLAEEQRKGSKRMGSALLNVHAQLGTEGAQNYQNLVRSGSALGHVAVIQGILWTNLGINLDSMCVMAANSLALNILSAGLRLGLIGHVDCQLILGRMHNVIEKILSSAVPKIDEIHAYSPAADIAMMRHEIQQSRLFAN